MAFADFENEREIAPVNLELKTNEVLDRNEVKELDGKIKGDMNKLLKESLQQQLEADKVVDVGAQRNLRALNDDPNTAYLVEIDGVYGDYITEENQTKWYAFESSSPGKLTVFLQTVMSTVIDYNLYLFKLNEDTMTLEDQVISSYPAGFNEQVAKIADEGIYYVAVSSNQGYDVNNQFLFTVKYSEVYDNNEVDDNIWTAKNYTGTVNHAGTIDNLFDEDWLTLTLTEAEALNTRLSNNASDTTDYQLDIFDASLNYLAGFTQDENFNNITFSAGTYYLRIASSSSFDATKNYQLIMNKSDGPAYRSKITKIGSDGGVEGFIDYGYGRKWRIKNNITIEGTLVDQYGSAVPYANIEFYIQGDLNNKIYGEGGITDGSGKYSIDMYIGHSIGKYMFNAPVSRHYFDIIPIKAMSGNTLLKMDDSSLYHFAYSMRY